MNFHTLAFITTIQLFKRLFGRDAKKKIEKREAAKIVFSDLFIVMRKALFYPSLLYFSVYLNSAPPFDERRKKKPMW